jgi:hypothetical protein
LNHRIVRKLRNQREESRHLGAFEQLYAALLDEIDGPFDVASDQGVIDSLAHHFVVGKPSRSRLVEYWYAFGVVALESAPEKVGEQMVVLEPVVVLVEPAQEEVATFDFFKQDLAAIYVREFGGEIAADPLGYRGGHQEVEQRWLE